MRRLLPRLLGSALIPGAVATTTETHGRVSLGLASTLPGRAGTGHHAIEAPRPRSDPFNLTGHVAAFEDSVLFRLRWDRRQRLSGCRPEFRIGAYRRIPGERARTEAFIFLGADSLLFRLPE